ncbi:MAG: T9SS type A sorting domain-containing protein [Bacteroidota bacterium]
MFGLNGQMVKQIQYGQLNSGTHQLALDAQSLAAGQYIVKVVAGNSSETVKLIRQ